MKNKKLKIFVLSALFAALVFVATAFLPHVPIPGGGGYVHFGDAVIYIGASILPLPYAMAAGALGSGLSDLLGGFVIWAPGTIIIKAAMAALFSHEKSYFLSKRNILSSVLAGVICVGGYFLYEWLIVYKASGALPYLSAIYNCAQALASAVLYIVVALTLDRLNFKEKFIKI